MSAAGVPPAEIKTLLGADTEQFDALGFTFEQVTVHCEGLVLFRALLPELFDDFLTLFGHLLAHPALLKVSPDFQARSDIATRYGLVNRHTENRAQTRLTALVEARLRAAGVEIPHR